MSVLFGSASSSWGVRRLLKALRHEAPGPQMQPQAASESSTRRSTLQDTCTARSVASPWRARSVETIREGSDLKTDDGEHARVGSMFKVQGEKTQKIGEARDGDLVAVAKIDTVKAGQWLGAVSSRRRSRSDMLLATARSRSNPRIVRTT